MKSLSVVSNTIWSMCSSFGIAIANFLLLPFMLHELGAYEYGLIGLSNVLSIAGYAALFELGFSTAIAKFTAEYHYKEDFSKISRMVSSSLALFLIVGAVLMAIGLIFSWYLSHHVFEIKSEYSDSFDLALKVIFITYLVQFPKFVFEGFWNGVQRFDVVKGTQLVTTLVYALSIVIVLNYSDQFLYCIVALNVLSSLQIVFYIFLMRKLFPQIGFSTKLISWYEIKDVWGMSRYIFLSRLSSIAYNRSDQLLISLFLGPIYIAYFEIVSKLPKFLKMIFSVINTTIIPLASRSSVDPDKSKPTKLFYKGLSYNFYIYYPILFVAYYFSQDFLSVWVGDEYLHLDKALKIYMIWNLLLPVGVFGNNILLGMNKKLKELTLVTWVGTAVKIIFILLFINQLEIVGIVLSTVISSIIGIPYVYYLYKKTLGISIVRIIRSFFLVVLTCGLFLYLFSFLDHGFINLKLNFVSMLLQSVILGLIIYSLLYFLVMKREEKADIQKYIIQFLRKFKPSGKV